jgi:hypothetical protein
MALVKEMSVENGAAGEISRVHPAKCRMALLGLRVVDVLFN